MADLDEIVESSDTALPRSAPLQIAVVVFTGVIIAVIWLVADPLGSSSGVVIAGSVAVSALLALAAAAAVREIRAGRFGSEAPAVDMPAPARVKLRWIWLIGLPAVPLLAIGLTLVFMNQPPAGGPWSHWDLLALRDFAFWLAVALAIWTLFVTGIAAARYRGTSVEAALLMCAVPGLFMIALLPAVRKVDCPSQIPRGDMLEPIPPGATTTEREQSSFRGSATLIQQIEASGESSDDLERRATDFYVAQGWQLQSDDGFIVRLAAGDWHLSVSGQKDYQAPGGPKDLGVQLGLTHFDEGCDWLS